MGSLPPAAESRREGSERSLNGYSTGSGSSISRILAEITKDVKPTRKNR
jgi:hypothetical protein